MAPIKTKEFVTAIPVCVSGLGDAGIELVCLPFYESLRRRPSWCSLLLHWSLTTLVRIHDVSVK